MEVRPEEEEKANRAYDHCLGTKSFVHAGHVKYANREALYVQVVVSEDLTLNDRLDLTNDQADIDAMESSDKEDSNGVTMKVVTREQFVAFWKDHVAPLKPFRF